MQQSFQSKQYFMQIQYYAITGEIVSQNTVFSSKIREKEKVSKYNDPEYVT